MSPFQTNIPNLNLGNFLGFLLNCIITIGFCLLSLKVPNSIANISKDKIYFLKVKDRDRKLIRAWAITCLIVITGFMIANPYIPPSGPYDYVCSDARVADADAFLVTACNSYFGYPEFQNLEISWRVKSEWGGKMDSGVKMRVEELTYPVYDPPTHLKIRPEKFVTVSKYVGFTHFYRVIKFIPET